jgi:hypothetical protein
MTADQVKTLLHAAPFEPFSVHLADGKSYLIDHPDFAMLTRGGRIMVVAIADDAAAHVDLMLATRVETHPRSGARGSEN